MIRSATPEDVEAIIALIGELADYEKLQHQVEASAESLRRDLFAAAPACQVLLAEVDQPAGPVVVGYALFFPSYSTFKTRACLYLEDLYVSPHHRSKGLGRALLAGVADAARRRGCPRMDWSVLDWNLPAIDFYEALGAELMPDWRTCRLEGDALARVASMTGSIS